MWVVDNVQCLELDNNVLNLPYGVRSSHVLRQYVSFFDDWRQAEREAEAMNLSNRECPCLLCKRHREGVTLTDADVAEHLKQQED